VHNEPLEYSSQARFLEYSSQARFPQRRQGQTLGRRLRRHRTVDRMDVRAWLDFSAGREVRVRLEFPHTLVR